MNVSDWVEVAWAEGLPAALRNAAMNVRAGMKDLAEERSSLYSQVAKYRFKNSSSGEGSSAGVSITVESNTVSAGTLSSNVKNLEKASATVDSQSTSGEGQTSTPQDAASTSSTEKQEHLESTDGDSKESGMPTEAQVDTGGGTADATVTTKVLEETANSSETAGDTSDPSVNSKDTAGTSGTSKDTSNPSSPETLEERAIGLTEFLELVRHNNFSGNSGTTDHVLSDATVASTSETGSKSDAPDQSKSTTSDDERSSEVVTSKDDKQSGMIYSMTR